MHPLGIFLVIAGLLLALAVSTGRWLHLRQENAALKAALESRADQVTALSHEMRTPLAVIIGSAGILAESVDGLPPRTQRFATSIVANASRLNTLAETLLTQARLEAGLFTVHRERVEVRTFLRDAIIELRQVIGRDIAIDTPGPPVYVDLDPNLVRQVLDNVVTNASRHDSAQGTLSVSLRMTERHVVISVHDQGDGIDERGRRQMFQKYSTTSNEGTGIGLYVSKKIIELPGGRILVDSLAGAGSSFLVLLPTGGES